MRDGHKLIGRGMATETCPGRRMPASALVRLEPEGRILVASGTQEIGTGNYTVLTAAAADVLRVPVSRIDAQLGDTNLPPAPITAGSMSTASVAPAVKAAAEDARQKLIALAVADQASPVYGARIGDVEFTGGKVALQSDSSRNEAFEALLLRHGSRALEGTASVKPRLNSREAPCHSFGAIFAEVAVDPDLGMARARRVVAMYDVGRIVNRKLAEPVHRRHCMAMKLISRAFPDGGMIPEKHAKDGGNISPDLKWMGVPDNARSLALVVDDPDAPSGVFDHWLVYGIPPDTLELTENQPAAETLPNGARQGHNGFGETGYGGPQPPSGVHRYLFRLYALDYDPPLSAGAGRQELDEAIKGHVLEKAELMGRHQHQEPGTRAAWLAPIQAATVRERLGWSRGW